MVRDRHKPTGMQHAILPVILLVLFAGIVSAGCDSVFGPPPVPVTPVITTPAATAVAATASPAVTVIPDAGPVQQPPPARQVNLLLTKDRPTSELHLLYQGGPGDIFTQKITMRVYNADGSVQDYAMRSGQKPVPGDEIVAPGTRGGDRCVVYLTSSGTVYKVIDEKVYAAGL
jgi:hypothetical protein